MATSVAAAALRAVLLSRRSEGANPDIFPGPDNPGDSPHAQQIYSKSLLQLGNANEWQTASNAETT
jgi:hypothetical protein